jgi:aminopeptidase N
VTDALPNWLQRALLLGFQHSAQLALTAPYVDRYFEVLDQIWATRDSEPAQEFVELAYPTQQVSAETVAKTEAWLAVPDRPASLRRLVNEGRDGVVRALTARDTDAAAA